MSPQRAAHGRNVACIQTEQQRNGRATARADWLRGCWRETEAIKEKHQGAGAGAKLSIKSPIKSSTAVLLVGGASAPQLFFSSRNL